MKWMIVVVGALEVMILVRDTADSFDPNSDLTVEDAIEHMDTGAVFVSHLNPKEVIVRPWQQTTEQQDTRSLG